MNKELKKLRVDFDYTQGQVANKLGISKYSYNKKENGKVPFTLEELKKIKSIFSLETEQVEQIFLT